MSMSHLLQRLRQDLDVIPLSRGPGTFVQHTGHPCDTMGPLRRSEVAATKYLVGGRM